MNMHVIIGEDDYLVDETAKKIIGDGLGLELIDSINATNAEAQLADLRRAYESFSTPPFLDPRKVTWWRNVHFLPCGGKKGPSEEVKTALEAFARKLVAAPLPENQHFILSGPHLLQSSIVAKTLSGAAEMLIFSPDSPWEAARQAEARVVGLARELGLTFGPQAASLFVSRVGTDTRSLLNELAKMRDYLGDKTTITTAAVDEITSPGAGVEPEVWAITDALGVRNLDRALAAAQRFAGESGFAVFLTSVVEKFFRQLVDLKIAADAGDTQFVPAGMNPKTARKQRTFLSNWTLAELRLARARFLDLREKAVSGSSSVDLLAITELVRVTRRRTRR